MRQMQPVLWTKGLLLDPQHLQYQDRHLRDVMEFRIRSLTFRPWGFSRLDIDRESLGGGVFALSAAAGLFPDGLLFESPESDPAPEPLPLGDLWDDDRASLDVMLAVPERRWGGVNVSLDTDASSRNTRYEAVSGPGGSSEGETA